MEVDPATNIEQACREYGNDPQVAYCQPNYRLEAQWIPNDPYYLSSNSWGQSYDDLWGLKKLQTAEAWDVTKGEGVVVAVVDTGVDYNHIELAANIWTNSVEIPANGIDDDHNGYVDDVRGWDFVNNDNDPLDGHGHGTHVSGTIAAVGNNELGIIGVAPSARIMPLKGLSDTGSGSSSGLATAIKYAADNGADVINNSWGCSSACPSNPVAEDAVKYAHDLGAVVVFAAGNSQNDVTLYSPGNQANDVITVASSTELDTRSYFSNIGSLIDVAAPGGGEDGGSTNRVGRNILSLRAGATDMYADGLCTVGTNYYRARGTSMAAPHVAGVAALVLAAHPAFAPDDVSQVLRGSADDIESAGFDLLSGAGQVNAQRAVSITSVPRVKITSPLAPVDVTRNGPITITGDAYGANFSSYRLYFATLDKSFDQGLYLPTVGAWQELGQASVQVVSGGVLATFDSTLLEPGRKYLVKLEVVTTDNARFSDVKEILVYKDDLRFYKLTESVPPVFVDKPVSAGDRFAWTEVTIGSNETTLPAICKVYDGATNKLVTIHPDGIGANSYIQDVHLTSNRIVWFENSEFTSRVTIGSLTPTGDIQVERIFDDLALVSADKENLLLTVRGAALTAYVYDVSKDIMSPAFYPPAYWSISPSLQGDSVATSAPGFQFGLPGYVISLTNTTTGAHQNVKVTDWENNYQLHVNKVVNAPGVVIWGENHQLDKATPLILFDKATQEFKTVAEKAELASFASDGNTVLYTAWGVESGDLKPNLYSYDVPRGATTLFAMNYVAGADEVGPDFGTRHIQWVRGGVKAGFYRIMVTNDLPALEQVSSQAITPNTPVTIPISASDPDGDKVDLSAVGGIWPDVSTGLPAGATFTDNGDGTGSFQWTPTTAGVYPVSFLARDFSGRKDGTWNTAQTATYLVHDPNDPLLYLGVTISGSGTVHSSPAPDLGCSSGTCSQGYSNGTVVTLTATPTSGYQLSSWSGACSGAGVCTVTMDQARMVTATFTIIPVSTLSVTIAGNGTVHSSPAPDINCATGTCSQSYSNGTVVTLTATPTSGYQFNGWGGACSGTGTCTVLMSQARSVTATFRDLSTVTLDIMKLGNGTIHSIPTPDINCTSSSCRQTYGYGTTVTLTASPDMAAKFAGWLSGPCIGTSACNVTMNQDQSVLAMFYACHAKISSDCSSIWNSYVGASSGATIKIMGLVVNESLDTDRDVSITLEGGYDTTFTTRNGFTTLQQLTVTSGTVTVSDIVIQ